MLLSGLFHSKLSSALIVTTNFDTIQNNEIFIVIDDKNMFFYLLATCHSHKHMHITCLAVASHFRVRQPIMDVLHSAVITKYNWFSSQVTG